MKKNIYYLIILLVTLITFSCNEEDDFAPVAILGCMDTNANNYNPQANADDGSCNYSTLGCTNPDAINYELNATEDDGSCIILGCIDLNAINYNENATNDDGSCEYSVEYLLGGEWDISLLEYSTEIDLSDIPTVGVLLGVQQINGEAINAGFWSFQNDGLYNNNLNFTTEPLNIATFEIPGVPIDVSSNGNWNIEGNDDILMILDNNTSTTSYYDILSIQNDIVFLSGTIPFSQEIMGFSFDLELEVEMQLTK